MASDIRPEDIFGDDGRASPDVVMAVLAQVGGGFGGTPIIGNDSVKVGDSFTIPDGMSYERAIDILRRHRDEAETMTDFERQFNYRPMDGAYATLQVMRERYGITLSKPIETLFGTRSPELRNVKISATETIQVPWGLIEIPSLKGVEIMMCDRHHHDEYGRIFCLHTTGPRKYRDELEQFFDAVEEQLRTSSIYRGQAIIGHDTPEFLDLSDFDANQVVYSGPVREQLEASLWSVLRYTEAMRRDGIPRKRAVLLHGPYGTGKTLTGQLTAQIATENGWTFIAARPGRDDLEDVMRIARLYQPAVVFFEDVDGATSASEDDEVAEMLDAFDGIIAKGGELLVVMTTNHIERIHKGMFRPGRLDALIPIDSLDRAGVEQLIKVYTKEGGLDDAVDYDIVYDAMEGFLPAFIREAVTRASSVALARVDGRPKYNITTDDLRVAAESLRPQLDQMDAANEGEKKPQLDLAIGNAVRTALDGGHIDHGDSTPYQLAFNGNGANRS